MNKEKCETCLHKEMDRDDFPCDECIHVANWNEDMYRKKEDVPVIKDSGNRREFSTGAVRDIQEGKGRFDLMPLTEVGSVMNDEIIQNIARFQNTGFIWFLHDTVRKCVPKMFPGFPDMFLAVAKHFEEGAKKYGENNWQKGLPVDCYIDSATRHYMKWLRGDKDEPHDRAFVWNILCCIWTVRHNKEGENNDQN